MGEFLTPSEVEDLEARYPGGITSAEVIKIFREHGIRLSEATFRKYVQLGLLPRSRRVGAKGKHRGSKGLYPASVIGKINRIKKMLADGLTLEDIVRASRRFAEKINGIDEGLQELFTEMEQELSAPHIDPGLKFNVEEGLRRARQTADSLIRTLENIEENLTSPRVTL